MRFIFTSAVKDLRRLRREPVTLLTWLGIPTFIAIILVVIFGRGDARPNGKLLIVDEDQGIGATLLAGAFSQGPLGNMISIEKVQREEGRRRVNKGDASALLVIPKNFTSRAARRKARQTTIGAQSSAANPAEHYRRNALHVDGRGVLSANRGWPSASRGRARPAQTDAGIAADLRSVQSCDRDFAKYLAPPLIQLETKVIQEKTDKPGGFAALMLPGMLYMAVFFIAGGLATDVWRERTSGALRRVVTTPASFGAFLGGKMLAVLLCSRWWERLGWP